MDRWSQGPVFSAHAHEQGWCLGRGLAWVLTCDPTLGSVRSGEQNHTSACQGLPARETLSTLPKALSAVTKAPALMHVKGISTSRHRTKPSPGGLIGELPHRLKYAHRLISTSREAR